MSAELALVELERAVLKRGDIAAFLKRADTLRKLLALGDDQILALVLAMTSPVVEAQALAAVLDAYGIGANDALDIVEAMGLDDIARIGRPSAEARATVAGLDRAGDRALAQAQILARAGADLQAVTAPILGHAAAISRRVTYAVNAAGNEGSTAVAIAAGLPLVWVAETDACVRCLRYSGMVVQPGENFPAGLTYGHPKYAVNGPVPHPPIHGGDRCTVEPMRSQDYADALRREADRSVLRGFSLASESMSVRVDAADRLLKHKNLDAPKSVKAYAASAVKRGKFKTRS